ncbi:dethiobiotin synthase [Methyloradius palustris]|uniref:ATP-dependent dethiobiotin synthetase BioD n=1 Tax=Methyloradius palustris TaxID=2778876 RepID=A0A8D5JRT8_9PROT|nr:dethiobiotin synthase [Methyloradius palustris]BCM25796.1 ATP-dependent dethiobiotin synthetase BioD [Methyloradius palustris]
MKQAYFVTGTDTGVGKTLIASALVYQFAQQDLKSLGMKPIAAGCELVDGNFVNEDVTQLIAASNVQAPVKLVNPYAFAPPIAPHIAAQQAGATISLDVIADAFMQLSALADVVIVEGAGGFCVPLDDHATMADLAVKLNIPVILVVGMRLGCINHALLTVEAIQSRGLKLAGWVANQLDPDMPVFEENIATLKLQIKSPYLGMVPWSPQPLHQNTPALISKLPI